MNFIIQRDYDFAKDTPLLQAIMDYGHKYYLCSNGLVPSIEDLHSQIYVFGSISFFKSILDGGVFKKSNAYDDLSVFNIICFRDRFSNILLNTDHSIYTYSALLHNKWDVYQKFAVDASIFIRPCSTLKQFSGCLLDIQDFDNATTEYSKNPDVFKEAIFVSSPKKIRAEWRFICSKNNVVASSLYLYQGLRSLVKGAPPKAIKIAQNVVDNSEGFPNMFVVDVCLLENGEYKLVELNPLGSSGLYACDRAAIIKEIVNIYDDSSTKNKASS